MENIIPRHKVLLFVESRYKVNRKLIKKTVLETLKQQRVETPVEVSVAIVGDRKMHKLNKQYRGLDKTTNVLSFSLHEGEAVVVSGENKRLGDVVLSYPQVIADAARDDVLVDEKVDELVAHGLLHLLGIHH